jgi:L-fucose isomerase-like protein
MLDDFVHRETLRDNSTIGSREEREMNIESQAKLTAPSVYRRVEATVQVQGKKRRKADHRVKKKESKTSQRREKPDWESFM